MKKGLTEMVFILDRSGSMSGLEKDTIGGFNSLIEKQKKLEGEAYVSTVLFDSETEVLHDRIPLDKIEPMTEKEYFVRGSTALLDAVGGAIHHIENIHKYAREEDIPENTIFVITTDGMENASHEYSRKTVKSMIEQKQKDGWEFVFLGANIDAFEAAESYGIPRNRTANYMPDSEGTEILFDCLHDYICDSRSSDESIKLFKSRGWAKMLDEDMKKRKGKTTPKNDSDIK